MFFVCQGVLFLLAALWLVGHLSPSHGEQQQHIHRVLAIGVADEKLMVITGPLRMINGYPLLFTMSVSALNDKKGQLYLKGVVPSPIGDKWTNFSSTQLFSAQKLLAHSVTYWDPATRQLFLMLDYNDDGNIYNTVVIGLQSNYLIERPQWFHSFVNDAWISTYEPMTFYLIKNGRKDEQAPFLGASSRIKRATRIAKAKCETAGDSSYPQISNLSQSTHYFTVCKVSDDPNNKIIFLSIDARCSYPVNWGVTSGFVDRSKVFLMGNNTAYFFDKSLFDNAIIQEKGEYTSRTFDEFLYTDHTLPPSAKPFSLPKWTLIPIALGVVVMITVVLFLIYCFCDCGTAADSNLESATSSNAKGDSKKPSPPAKSKKSKPTKKTKRSKKSVSNNKKSKRSGKPASNKKSKKSKKTGNKSGKNQQMDLEVQMGSDQLPVNLSQKMPSLKTNDADGNSQKQTGKNKPLNSLKSTKSSNKGKIGKQPMNGKMAQSIKPLTNGGGPLMKNLNAGSKQPLTKMKATGKQPASFKTSASKKSKGASMNSKIPDEGGSLRPQPSPEQGRSKREEDDGSMRGDPDD